MTFLLILQAGLLAAEDVRFEATVNRTQVELGAVIMLTLTVEGDVQPRPVELPPMEGFESRYVGPSSHISIHGTEILRRHSFMYNLYPQKTGTLTIPPVTTVLGGQTYRTEPIEIEVTDTGRTPAGAGEGASLNDKIFVVLNVPRKEVYLNEEIPVTVKLFISELSVSNIHYPNLKGAGIKTADYPPPDQYKQVIGGIAYDVVEFSTAVYPTETGELTLGPAGIKCTLLFKKDISRQTVGPRSLFDEDFFESFFGAYDAREAALQSTDVTLTVKPLPEEGRPADFSGAVGRFDLDVTVSPDRVRVGDPLTLRMRVSGDGNMDAVRMPAFEENEDFKVYQPQITEKDGMKILEQVVIPRHAGVRSFPAVRFSYFDPREEKYKTVTKGPTVLTVEQLKEDEALRAVGLQDNLPELAPPRPPETVGRDIRYIKEFPDLERHRQLWNRPAFWVLVLLTVLAWAGAAGADHYRRKIAADQRFARRLRAPRRAREGLARAQDMLAQERPKEFYDVLDKTIGQYFADRFHIPPGAVNLPAIKDRAESEGRASPHILEKLEALIRQCEGARFAAEQPGPSRMREDLLKAREIIDYYQRR